MIMKFDMHCHTAEGSIDGKVPVRRAAELLKEKGFDGMLVSDHDSYKGYQAWCKCVNKPKDFVVLKGIEYDTIDAGHILVIMPSSVSLKILELRGLPIALLIEIVHKNGGILGPAHPCGEKFLSIVNTLHHKKLLHVLDKFDFIEGYNACEEDANNEEAKKLGEKYSKPMFGGSDSHKEDGIGFAYTIVDANIKNEDDLIKYIKNGGKPLFGGEFYHGTTKEKLGAANKILVNGFWFYNKWCGIWRRRKRKAEINKLELQHFMKKYKKLIKEEEKKIKDKIKNS